jgi:hypothetical protein
MRSRGLVELGVLRCRGLAVVQRLCCVAPPRRPCRGRQHAAQRDRASMSEGRGVGASGMRGARDGDGRAVYEMADPVVW